MEKNPAKLARKVQEALESPRLDALAERFIKWMIKNWGKPEEITWAIQNNSDPLKLAFNEWGLDHYWCQGGVRLLLRLSWDIASKYLRSAVKVYEVLSENRQLKTMLDTEQGHQYLNRMTQRCYDVLYTWVWDYELIDNIPIKEVIERLQKTTLRKN